MTVSTTDSVIEYVSGGPAFPIPYRFLQNSDIEAVLVKQDGTSETLALGTQYTLTGAGTQSGGTLTSAYAAGFLATVGASLTISRVMAATQPTDLRNQGRFLAETHETVLDRLTMLIQQGFSILGRALLRPIGKNYYDAHGRQIKKLADPTDTQDAATMGWTDQFVANLIAKVTGPINNAENVFYRYPNGSTHVVQDLAETDGVSGIGAPFGTVADYISRRRPVSTFGVIGDGVADDSDAIEDALLSGVPFKSGPGIIRITRRISGLVPGQLNWVSDGTIILNGSTSETPACIDLEVLPGFNHRIEGVLQIDGNLLSSVGIRIWNKSAIGFPLGYATLYAADVQVKNIRRGFVTSANGDGIIVRGGFTSVILDRPVVSNVRLAAGAGILGSVGACGITVFGINTGFPIVTILNDPQIDTILSEDPAYNADQDGCRIFGPWDTAGAKTNSVFIINGGSFRDCWGRSVKSQAETCVIKGTNFSSFSGPTSGRNSEIDCQVGGGMISDITVYLSGANTTPNEIVSFQPSPTFESFAGKLNGCQVTTTHPLTAVVSTFLPAKTQHKITVRDVDVIGPLVRLVEFRVWMDKTTLLLDGCTVNNLTGQLVRVTASGAGGAPFVGKVTIKNATNIGPAAPLVTDKVAGLAANSIVSTQDVDGFTLPAQQAESAANLGGATRVNSLTGIDSSSGSLEPMSKNIAAGATVTFPIRGFNNSAAAVVSIGAGNLAHGLVAISSAGVVNLTAGATDIVTGTTTEPVTGNYRLWISGGLLQVKNNTATARQCTLFYMG